MFSFMDFGMPSMYGNTGRNTMRASARPSHRRFDTAWDFFDPQPEPVYHYQPRQTVTSRNRPSYYHDNNGDDEDECTSYEHERRAPRSSYGGHARQQYYHTTADNEDTTVRGATRPQTHHYRRQPESYRQHQRSYNVASNEDSQEETQRPAAQAQRYQKTPSHQHDSLWDQLRSEPLFRGSQTTRRKPDPAVDRSQFNEHKPSKTTSRAQPKATKPQTEKTVNNEKLESNHTSKTTQSKPQQPAPSPNSAKATQSTQHMKGKKVVIEQEKGDVVVIEDVTPTLPKRNPALEPSKGFIIEEVSSSQN